MTSAVRTSEDALVIWRFIDGKPGHESQTLGLVFALADLREVDVHDFRVDSNGRAFLDFVFGSFKAPESLPKPDFILGAGHSTHWSMLAARRAHGGKTVVLMKPSLPLSWFDQCVIPKHDNPASRSNVKTTEGVLNPIRPAKNASLEKGLILIGGESQHYVWDDSEIQSQLDVILSSKAETDWTLTTSRRTPELTIKSLLERDDSNLTVVPHYETPKGWVAEQLEQCGETWVSPDSMSMLYESMSASPNVGVFQLDPKRRDSRVVRALEGLLEESRLSIVEHGQVIRPKKRLEPLSEASRVAAVILGVS